MTLRAAVVAVLALAVLVLAVEAARVPKGAAQWSHLGTDSEWLAVGRAAPDARLRLVFGVRQNRDAIVARLEQVSHPRSAQYGKYLTMEEVARLSTDPADYQRVMRFLAEHRITEVQASVNRDFITAHMTAAQAEELLDTEYHVFQHRRTGRRIHRTASYSLPESVADAVDVVSHTVQFPHVSPRFVAHGSRGASNANVVTPQLLWHYYGINDTVVNVSSIAQSVYENLGQSYAPKDLTSFQNKYQLYVTDVAKVIGPNDPSACQQDPDNCGEATLDVQYMMAVAQNASMWYWSIPNSDPDPFLDWANAVGNTANPPQVHSISYGEVEPEGDADSYKRFDTEVAKLGLRGITVVVASGDDGVANFVARSDKNKCAFNPSFPASAPHVTAVGASMGPEMGTAETACTSQLGGLVTTGGGFSTVFEQPSYQADAVQGYLSSGVKLPPASQWNKGGRAYPDVGVLGHNYAVIINGQQVVVSGTSASAPVFGAMITLVNSARANIGQPPLGFLNPTLYSSAESWSGLFRDITVGENNCCAGQPGSQVCCPYGFFASSGWDPLTGLGGVSFGPLMQVLLDA